MEITGPGGFAFGNDDITNRASMWLADASGGRTNIGAVNLDANQLIFAKDGSLTLTLSHTKPEEAAAQANWLPAPEGQFALIIRAYVPGEAIQDDSYRFPDLVRE